MKTLKQAARDVYGTVHWDVYNAVYRATYDAVDNDLDSR